MGKAERATEPAAQADALTGAGIAIGGRITAPGRLEGGDLIWIDERTLAVGRGYRTSADGIGQLRALVGEAVDVVEVPLPHWRGQGDVMHLMSLISPVDRDLAVVYSRLLPVPFREWLLGRGMTLVEVPDDEFETMATNVLALAPRRCLMLAGNPRTRRALEQAGCEVLEYEGTEISVKGAGGPTCLTRPYTPSAQIEDLSISRTNQGSQIMNHQWMVSRREWLKRVGAAAAIPPKLLLPLVSPSGEPVAVLAQSPGVPVGTAPATLTAAESETLEGDRGTADPDRR